jgi:hypothetical protein
MNLVKNYHLFWLLIVIALKILPCTSSNKFNISPNYISHFILSNLKNIFPKPLILLSYTTVSTLIYRNIICNKLFTNLTKFVSLVFINIFLNTLRVLSKVDLSLRYNLLLLYFTIIISHYMSLLRLLNKKKYLFFLQKTYNILI